MECVRVGCVKVMCEGECVRVCEDEMCEGGVCEDGSAGVTLELPIQHFSTTVAR